MELDGAQSAEERCPVAIGGEQSGRCGRPLHHPSGDPSITGKDLRPVCLMHSVDRTKMSGPLYDDFVREIESILEAAGEGEAAFDEFVFPNMKWEGKRFRAKCRFDSAVFWIDPRLDRAVFEKDVSFGLARFETGASFRKAEMKGSCNFMGAEFTYQAYFSDAVFAGSADFSLVTFSHEARFERAAFSDVAQFTAASYLGVTVFREAGFGGQASFDRCRFAELVLCGEVKFAGSAGFEKAEFLKNAFFSMSEFDKEASWDGASFAALAGFGRTRFHENAVFRNVTLSGNADFSFGLFAQGGDFTGTVFTGNVNYDGTTFSGTAEWVGTKFLDGAQFRVTNFNVPLRDEPCAVFELALFAKPKEVVFDEVDLSRAMFHDCDVSEVRFSPSARWGERENRAGAMIFEETINLEGRFGQEIARGGRRDYRAVAKIYQQLKKNYDASLDYWTADQFHFGEMEMKRLAVDGDRPLYRIRKWFLPRFGLVAWYRYASDYGNNYVKPMAWMVVLLVGFAALYPLPGVGLARSGVSGAETYANVPQAKLTMVQNAGLELELVGRSLLAAIDVAGFQKSPEYTPSYPWGRVLAIVETVLTSTLFGLFLLAIRRQFRR